MNPVTEWGRTNLRPGQQGKVPFTDVTVRNDNGTIRVVQDINDTAEEIKRCARCTGFFKTSREYDKHLPMCNFGGRR